MAAEQLGVRVVPLLETLRDLDNAATIVGGLLSVPWYREHLRRVQSSACAPAAAT